MGGRLVAAGTTDHLIAMQHAGDADAAAQPLQLEDRESLRRADHGVPQFQRRAAPGAGARPVALAAFRFQRLITPLPLGSWLLAGLAPAGRWFRRRRTRCTSRRALGTGGRDATRIAATVKWRIGRGRPGTVGRIHRQTLGLLDHDGLEPAKQLDKLGMIQRLECGAIHSGQGEQFLGLHARSESQILPLGKPKHPGKPLKTLPESISHSYLGAW